MPGLIAYGVYVPYWRLQRAAITASLGSGGGRGTRSVASYDEDTTSMGVEAARAALAAAPQTRSPGIVFSTTRPAYLDKTNATAIHAALNLDQASPAYDVIGSVRSADAALTMAMSSPGPMLAVLSDVRIGLPGGADESGGGDAAAAFLFGDGTVIAEPVAQAHATAEFLDRWRAPEDPYSRQWEERFGEHAYLPLAGQAVKEAFAEAGIDGSTVDHLVVTGAPTRAVRRVAGSLGARPESVVPDLTDTVGFTGAAHPGLLLAEALDRADPGQTIALVTLADGVDVLVLRTTAALPEARTSRTLADQVAAGRDDLAYAQFLTWRGFLRREPPRRPDPDRPAAPPSFRTEDWKFGFIGSRCEACGTRHLPPQRVCVKCQAVDLMTPEPLASVPATIATYTVDRLAFSLSPPVVAAVIDFDGGGRFQCELTDVDPDSVAIGDRVEMTFRRLFTADGVHNYFWKARPLRA